jgi:riboflavin kinase/FMN adenylyltransferase
LGRTIGFPTLNLDVSVLSNDLKEGVYASTLQIHGKSYKGMLYLGPRLVVGETKTVLEIHVFDFDQEIYGDEVEFEIGKYIRGIANFSSMEEMKKQLQNDKATILELLDGTETF